VSRRLLANVRLLLDHEADVNGGKLEGALKDRPLHLAISVGARAIVEALLEKGADINLLNGQGFAPLHVAFGAGHPAIAEFLLSRGANRTAAPARKAYQATGPPAADADHGR